MKKNVIILMFTFVIGGGIGAVVGVKVFAEWFKRYIKSDECKEYWNEQLDKIFDESRSKIRNES